jgi:anion-transporting  ArsA/GET3 family ATPase
VDAAVSETNNIADRAPTDEELELLTSPTDADANTESLEQWAKRAATAVSVLEAQRRRYEEKDSTLKTMKEANDRQRNELKIEAENQRQERETLASKEEELLTRQKGLNEREADVKSREMEAEQGFSSRFKH